MAWPTHVVVTHGHFDHIDGVSELAKQRKIPMVGQFDVITWLSVSEGVETVGSNNGGMVTLGEEVKFTMVHAMRSSTMMIDGALQTTGS